MILRFPALVALILVLAFAIACGGDDDDGSTTPTGQVSSTATIDPDATPSPTFEVLRDPTLQEYFARVEEIFGAANVASNNLIASLNSEIALAEDFQKEMEANVRFLGDTIDVYSFAIGQMSAVEPPDAVSTYHRDFIDNATEGATIASHLQIQLQDVRTEEEASELIQQFETDIAAVITHADETACNLESIAEANGLVAELNCAGS